MILSNQYVVLKPINRAIKVGETELLDKHLTQHNV